MLIQEIVDLIYRIGYYKNYYRIIQYTDNQNSPQYVSNSKEKICRFCNRKSPEVTFKTKAHAIPELFGNKNLISRDECDACNKFFGEKLEDDFSKYLGFERIAYQISGKNGIPSYKLNNKLGRIDNLKNNIFVIQQCQDTNFFKIDKNKNEIIVHEDKTSFFPIAIYKTLVKMAISILPVEELQNFDDTIRWLKEEEHSNLMNSYAEIIVKYIPVELQKYDNPLKITGFIRKDNNYLEPYYQVLLEFRSTSYQFIVPCRKKECIFLKRKINNIIIPATHELIGDIGKSEIKIWKEYLNITQKFETKGRDFSYKYSEYKDLPIEGKKIEEILQKIGLSTKKALKTNNK